MKTIHHALDIDSEPGTVWRALTVQPGIAEWWSPVVHSPPPTVGAITSWTFEPGFNPIMEITAIEPETDLLWRCIGGHDPWNDNTFRFQVSRPQPLRFNRFGLLDEPAEMPSPEPLLLARLLQLFGGVLA